MGLVTLTRMDICSADCNVHLPILTTPWYDRGQYKFKVSGHHTGHYWCHKAARVTNGGDWCYLISLSSFVMRSPTQGAVPWPAPVETRPHLPCKDVLCVDTRLEEGGSVSDYSITRSKQKSTTGYTCMVVYLVCGLSRARYKYGQKAYSLKLKNTKASISYCCVHHLLCPCIGHFYSCIC